MSRQDHIREFAAKALADGRVDYFIGWKQGYNSSEVIPAFVKDPATVDELIWNPLCHHNLVTFIKRNMPDPAGAKIGVCVKGCDSRTLGALLQEELVDKDQALRRGRSLRRHRRPAQAGEGVRRRDGRHRVPRKGQGGVTTRAGETERIRPKKTSSSRSAATAATPTRCTSDDTAGPLEAEPERDLVPPDWSDVADYENLSDDAKQDAAGADLLNLRALFRLHQRVPGVLLLGQVREPVPAAGTGEPEGGPQGEPAVPDGAHVPRGRPLPVVRGV